MADIRRNVPDIQPHNYVNPGVRQPSPLSLAAAVGDAAINLDVQLAKERLAQETEGLRTTYEVSSFAATDVQDSTQPPKEQLTPGDKMQVSSLSTNMASNQAAVDQGRMSYDEYRVRGERMLRLAISKRPGLAQEFRAVAAQHLGVDVVGASVDVLASAEHQILAAQAAGAAKTEKPTQDFKRMRDQLDVIGVPNGHLTDEQAMVAYMQNGEAIKQALQQKAESEFVTTAAATQKGGQELRRPAATADFLKQVSASKLEFYKSFSQGYAAMKSGQMKASDMASVINSGSTQLNGRLTELRMAMANGDVDKEIAEKEITGLQELGNMMTELASGKLDATIQQNRLDAVSLYMQNAMMDNENVAIMSAATKVFSPEIMLPFVQQGGSFNKAAMKALGDTLMDTGSASVKAQNAGSTASAMITTVLDRGGSKSNPEMVPKMAETLANAGKSFVEMPTKDFKADYLTGPQGYLTVLHTHREALSKALGAEAAQEVGGSASMAAMASYQALAASIGSKYPSLAGKLSFGLDPTSGDFIHPKGKVTPVEAAAIKSYNRAFDGKKIIQTLQSLTGATPQEAVALFGSSYQAYKESKDASKKAAATSPTKGDHWWSNF